MFKQLWGLYNYPGEEEEPLYSSSWNFFYTRWGFVEIYVEFYERQKNKSIKILDGIFF